MKKNVVLLFTAFLLTFCVLLCACSDQPQKDKENTGKAEQTYSSSEIVENTTEPDTEASSEAEQTENVQTENTQPEPPHTTHTYGEWFVKTAATCEGKGTKIRLCTVCGNTETEDIAPVGHSMGGWVIIREPTCTVDGSQQRKCTTCGFTESAGIGKPHSYVSTVVPPTATEQGYTEHVCSGCGDTYRDTYTDPTGQPELHVHSFGAYVVTTPADCETAGVKTSTCAGCGETKTLPIDATGHSMGDWVITRQPTCNGGGMRKRECHNCGYYETEGISVPHSYVSTVVPPTATEQGYTEHVCSSCGDTYKDNYTDPTGQPEPHIHSFDVYVVTTPADCETAGEETSTCSCGEKDTRPIDAKGHNYGSTVVPPTTTEQGYTLYTCSVCGDSYKDNYTSATGSEGLSFSLSNDGTYYTLTGLGTCTDTDIVIPSTYEGLPVTKISTYAFCDKVQIESVVIPEGIVEIGASSFAGTNIKSITLPSSLKTVTGFANCIKLTSVTISAGATSIGNNAFNGCTSLVSITIPEGVESIGYQSFANCGALSTVKLPSTLKTIGKSSFYFCSALKTLEIPSSVTLIDEFSFYKSGLETITIPDSVKISGLRHSDSAKALRQLLSRKIYLP